MLSLTNRLSKRARTLFRGGPAAEIPSETSLSLSALPSLEQILKKPDILPQDCLRFFQPSPLEDEDLLVGRAEELDRLEKALKSWEEGHPGSVALVGPPGSGKTSLVNCFVGRHPGDWRFLRCEVERRLSGENLVLDFFNRLFQLDPPAGDPGNLIERLLAAEPRIVVIEGVHSIFLRVLGGRKAAELFFYVLLGTRPRHFWLLTCRYLPWNSMDLDFQASRFFSHVVPVEPLPEDALRTAFDMRIRGSGLNPVFYRSKDEPARDLRAGEDRQEEKEQAFFKALFANSGRNLYSSLYFLLLSSRYEEDTRSIFLWPPERLDMTFIKDMDRLTLLSVAEIARHGVLSPREHGRIFRTEGIGSLMVFEHLEQSGLLVPLPGEGDDSERPFEVSPVVHHTVAAALEQLNLLY